MVQIHFSEHLSVSRHLSPEILSLFVRNKNEKTGNLLLVRLPHSEKQHHEVAVKTRVQEENWKKGYTNTVTIVRKQNIAISQIFHVTKTEEKR